MSDGSFEQYMQNQEALNLLVMQQEFVIVSMLKPRIFIDGNQWCVLHGENLHDGIAGFGESPILAIYDFNKAWHKKLPNNTA